MKLKDIIPTAPDSVLVLEAHLDCYIDAIYMWYAGIHGLDYDSLDQEGVIRTARYKADYHYDVNRETLRRLIPETVGEGLLYSGVSHEPSWVTRREAKEGYYLWTLDWFKSKYDDLLQQKYDSVRYTLPLCIAAEAAVRGVDLHVDIRGIGQFMEDWLYAAACARALGCNVYFSVDEAEGNEVEYKIMYDYTLISGMCEENASLSIAKDVRESVKRNGFREGGLYLLAVRCKGRNVTVTQEYSVRLRSRVPESVKLIQLCSIGDNGITYRVIPQSLTYASRVESYRRLREDQRGYGYSELRLGEMGRENFLDYRDMLVEGDYLTDADNILCKISDRADVPFDEVVWLGEPPCEVTEAEERLSEEYRENGDFVSVEGMCDTVECDIPDFDPNGGVIARRLKESELIRTMCVQEGYDIDYELYDEEHDLIPSWFMVPIAPVSGSYIYPASAFGVGISEETAGDGAFDWSQYEQPEPESDGDDEEEVQF